jgi:hypothetical protein
LYVVEADGNNSMAAEQWPSPGSAPSDFFFKGNNAEFSSSTKPASLWGLKIYNISAASDTMTFYIGTGTVPVQYHSATAQTHLHANTALLHRYNLLGRCEGVMQSGTACASRGMYIILSPSYISKEMHTR